MSIDKKYIAELAKKLDNNEVDENLFISEIIEHFLKSGEDKKIFEAISYTLHSSYSKNKNYSRVCNKVLKERLEPALSGEYKKKTSKELLELASKDLKDVIKHPLSFGEVVDLRRTNYTN